MNPERSDKLAVTLLLHDREGREWPLTLSAGCLKFIGRYRRIEAFDIDPLVLLQGVSRAD